MKKEFLEKLEQSYLGYSTGYKKIVKFIRFNQNKLPFLNIKELAEETGTSPATITRFVKGTGFKGYSEFQKLFQQDIAEKSAPMKKLVNCLQEQEEKTVLKNVVDKNIEILSEMDIDKIDMLLDATTEFIKKGRKVYILGARGSYPLAHYLYYMLKEVRDGVELFISGASEFTDKLLYAKPEDILITISFSPYTNFSYQVMEYFKENGNKIVMITDRDDSSLAQLAEIVITTQSGGKAHTIIPAIAVLNALSLKLATINKNESITKLEKLENITDKFNIYRTN